MNVLLVEDEPRVADFIDRGLRAENHGVTVAASGSEGVDLAKTGEFDVIVLDLMLPDMHGHDVCQRLRLQGDHTPILMLTAMDALEDKIKGIKIGADDYLTKPFDFDELLVRIKALVRRSHQFAQSSNVLKVADLELDRDLLDRHGRHGLVLHQSSRLAGAPPKRERAFRGWGRRRCRGR